MCGCLLGCWIKICGRTVCGVPDFWLVGQEYITWDLESCLQWGTFSKDELSLIFPQLFELQNKCCNLVQVLCSSTSAVLQYKCCTLVQVLYSSTSAVLQYSTVAVLTKGIWECPLYDCSVQQFTYSPCTIRCQLVLEDEVEYRAGVQVPLIQEKDGQGGVHN